MTSFVLFGQASSPSYQFNSLNFNSKKYPWDLWRTPLLKANIALNQYIHFEAIRYFQLLQCHLDSSRYIYLMVCGIFFWVYAIIHRVVLGLYGGDTLNWLSHMFCSHSQNKQLTTLNIIMHHSQLNAQIHYLNAAEYIKVSCLITGQLVNCFNQLLISPIMFGLLPAVAEMWKCISTRVILHNINSQCSCMRDTFLPLE